MKVFAGDFTDRMTEGFKSGSPYSDVTDSPSELPMKSPKKWVRRWFHWQKLIYYHSANPLRYFSFFFPIPTLLSQTANNQPPQKNLPLLSTSHISLSFVVTTSMFRHCTLSSNASMESPSFHFVCFLWLDGLAPSAFCDHLWDIRTLMIQQQKL